MEVRIETTAENRKDLVKAIEQFTGERSIYLGPPNFQYQIGELVVNRDSSVTTENAQKAKEVRAMLASKGLCTQEDGEMSYDGGTSIKVPLGTDDAQTVKNLVNMLHARQYLLNRAVGADNFKVGDGIIATLETAECQNAEDAMNLVMQNDGDGSGFFFEDGNITFSGFPYSTDSVTVKAYCELAAAMVKAAREHKRIKSDEVIEENEKYYMRAWLVSIGFGGKDAKETRKVLLDKLKGHTAFRTPEDGEKWKAARKLAKGEAE